MENLFFCPLKYSPVLCFWHAVRTFSKSHKYKSVPIKKKKKMELMCRDQGQNGSTLIFSVKVKFFSFTMTSWYHNIMM